MLMRKKFFVLSCCTYIHVLEMFMVITHLPLPQCKLFSKTIICLYGCVGKWIDAVTDGNKLLMICQLIWHKYSHNIGSTLNGAELYQTNQYRTRGNFRGM